jgi:hypothetical protein
MASSTPTLIILVLHFSLERRRVEWMKDNVGYDEVLMPIFQRSGSFSASLARPTRQDMSFSFASSFNTGAVLLMLSTTP